jgi:hypothetical protein
VRIGLLLAILLAGCSRAPDSGGGAQRGAGEPAASVPAVQSRTLSRLRVDGLRFVDERGTTFQWRGISAFRLLEFVARGRAGEAEAFLDWAAQRKLSVVRVFVTARHLFQLAPDEGVRDLPRLLKLAAARGLYVEVVALADTADIEVDLEAHVKAVGGIAASHPNALVEIANEPWHPTQDKRLHVPAYVRQLAALVPQSVPVALGSAEGDGGYAQGAYATWHSPRAGGAHGWQHVVALAEGAGLMRSWGKPVVGDEPIGAADAAVAGRRDDDPGRFAAAAALTRLAGLGATFHYEGGLQARIPTGRELECLTAWSSGLDLLDGLPDGGSFVAGEELNGLASVRNARAAFGRRFDSEIWIVAVDPAADVSVALTGGWRLDTTRRAAGVTLFRGSR